MSRLRPISRISERPGILAVLARRIGRDALLPAAFAAIMLVGWPALPAGAASTCSSASPAEAKAMALKAAAFLEGAGPEKALPAFMRPDGEFFDRDLYVFVIGLDGTTWVNGAFPQAIGGNALQARDSRGRYYVQEMIRLAHEHGEGWVEYEWINPCSGELGPKVSFIKRVGPVLVGVGAYGTISARNLRALRPAG